MPRLFVAVRPPAAVLEALHELPRPDEPGVRWVPPSQWHVTLRFLGDAPVADAARALRAVRVDAPVVAVLGPRVSRLGRNVVCVPCAGLDELAASVVAATREIGAPPDDRPFAGHVTLARLKHRAACGVAGTAFAASFPVTEIELVRSTLSSAGAVHDVVAAQPV